MSRGLLEKVDIATPLDLYWGDEWEWHHLSHIQSVREIGSVIPKSKDLESC